MVERTCIVTRETKQIQDLIRFVIAPDGRVVADLKAHLPGRGAWTLARRQVLIDAVKRRAFQRAFKADIIVEDDLPQRVEVLLRKRACAQLALARKAGVLVAGSAKVSAAIRAGEVVLVFHAEEAAEDGRRKILQTTYALQQKTGKNIAILSLFSAEEMAVAFGGHPVVHAALLHGQAAAGLMGAIEKWCAYRDETCGARITV
ncbi:RNA-binding protein [Bartonella sp. DGB2]|uniref:RNA-binding protein n=1 Tax=Bartonella sp. DGB2 TaxID=3388426 RepID=UPI00398FD41E